MVFKLCVWVDYGSFNDVMSGLWKVMWIRKYGKFLKNLFVCDELELEVNIIYVVYDVLCSLIWNCDMYVYVFNVWENYCYFVEGFFFFVFNFVLKWMLDFNVIVEMINWKIRNFYVSELVSEEGEYDVWFLFLFLMM